MTNRLKQVTSAIRQDGINQVSLITGGAEKQAAVEFAKAAALRPQILGKVLGDIMSRPRVGEALFTVLETQMLVNSKAEIALLPRTESLLSALVASRD